MSELDLGPGYSSLTHPNIIIRELNYAMSYARERVLQGDWSETFARKAIDKAVVIAEYNLRGCGCTHIDLYGSLSAGCRANLKWSFFDRDGEMWQGSGHPI